MKSFAEFILESPASNDESVKVWAAVFDVLKKQPEYRPGASMPALSPVTKLRAGVFSVGNLNGQTDYTVDFNKKKILSVTHTFAGTVNKFEYDMKSGAKTKK